MTILILYETIEGQTGKIAHFINDTVKEAGLETKMVNTFENAKKLSFEGIDKVILAAPVHERRHPELFEISIKNNLADLLSRPTLMASVSLSAAFPQGIEEAGEYLTEMEMRTKFAPTYETLVAGAVRISGYGYYESLIVRLVVLHGKDYSIDDGPREFTDWDALRNTVTDFLEH